MAALESAFASVGGRYEILFYDRMRTVVIGSAVHDAGKRWPKHNATFDAFARHWGFTPPRCQPYREQTKGKVESGVRYLKRNFVPGRVFHGLDDFNAQPAASQLEVADQRVHGTTHQRPIERFSEKARALLPVAGQGSFLQAMVRERVVAEDWLISLEGNRYLLPFGLIGKTAQVVREGGTWVMRYRGGVIGEPPVLTSRARLSVHHENGPGAAARSARQHYAEPAELPITAPIGDSGREAEVRDLALYDRLFIGQAAEVACAGPSSRRASPQYQRR